ncbi:calcineurin B-like protein [Musa troglodytarum]|uniref:Calcineurin B-like protein n=1 Tax=Musa troglodytarum TaxID=320322 RepID=A0A9E7JZ77_9LILI|nr:calcineurin B-like protein [Musa troglodytarum]
MGYNLVLGTYGSFGGFNLVFGFFDEKKNGVIEFEEFIHALSVKQMVVAILRESHTILPNDLLEAILDTAYVRRAGADWDNKINRVEWKNFVMRHPALLKNLTLPYLKDVTTLFPSFVFNTVAED